MLVFHAYINEMHGSEAKFPVKNLVRQRCSEGFNFGVKGLIFVTLTSLVNEQRIFLPIFCWNNMNVKHPVI
jgi:hypothetical protein